jgi:phage-related minor tail protein
MAPTDVHDECTEMIWNRLNDAASEMKEARVEAVQGARNAVRVEDEAEIAKSQYLRRTEWTEMSWNGLNDAASELKDARVEAVEEARNAVRVEDAQRRYGQVAVSSANLLGR